MQRVDWNTYADTFPTRYLEHGYFDAFAKGVLQAAQPKRILDVGGGPSGTLFVREYLSETPSASAVLLDPFVMMETPSYNDHLTTLEHCATTFDAVVLRGSLNYLTIPEIDEVYAHMNQGGVLIANTFWRPPSTQWSSRSYTTRNGDRGVERARYNNELGMVEHELRPDTGPMIEHRFYYHDPAELQARLSGEVMTYGENSAVLLALKR